MLFFGLAVTVSTAFAGFVGASIVASQFGAPYWRVFQTWWVGDAMGLLMVTPLLMGWLSRSRGWSEDSRDVPTWQRFLSWSGLIGASLLFNVLPTPDDIGNYTLLLAILPFQFVIAARLRMRDLVTANAAVTVIGLAALMLGVGNFAGRQGTTGEILALQCILASPAFATMLLSAAFAGQRQVERRALAAEARLLDAIESMSEAFALFVTIRSRPRR